MSGINLRSRLKIMKYLVKETFREWSSDRAPKLAAALAFYTIFAIAPLFVVLTSLAGLLLGKEAAQGQIVAQIGDIIGQKEAEAVQAIIQNASQPTTSTLSALGGLIILLIAATGVFNELRESMNIIWNVPPRRRGVRGLIRGRLLSFLMVLCIGVLLFLSVALTTALTATLAFFGEYVPGTDWVWQISNFAISLIVITALFAAIFKILPDAKVKWREVALGAFITALLFSIGKTLISLYLGRSSVLSAHGAAGSLVLILLWVYYSTQILFLGAEFTQVHANFKSRQVSKLDLGKSSGDPHRIAR